MKKNLIVEDLGQAAYCKLKNYKCVGKKGKAYFFEVEQENAQEFRLLSVEYINSPYHDFDAHLMSLKKISEIEMETIHSTKNILDLGFASYVKMHGFKCLGKKNRNFLFEVPGINKKLFVQDAQKIVPSLSVDDIEYAKGFGGVRPQVLNKTEKKLMLGEASITEEKGIIYNMTPSPGATSCLGNAERDIKIVCEYLGKKFNEEQFLADFTDDK